MIIDVLIVILLIVMVLLGKKRGLMKSLVSIVGFFISILLAISLCKPVGDFIVANTDWDDSIKSVVSNSIKIDDVKLDVSEQYPDIISKYVSGAVDGINDTKENIKEEVSIKITDCVIYAISYVIVFILTKITVTVLRFLSKIVEKLPIINKMNDLGGALLGLAQGIIAVYIILTVISVLSPMMPDSMIIDQVNNSYIGKFVYNNNIVGLFLKN
ncbi:MAG: CvpA family protein [Clostridia bacterium]|nr:CvpA family protein [Bacilli bacterium]MBR3324794.1 CvpA family protein [Clostridia bacterium]